MSVNESEDIRTFFNSSYFLQFQLNNRLCFTLASLHVAVAYYQLI